MSLEITEELIARQTPEAQAIMDTQTQGMKADSPSLPRVQNLDDLPEGDSVAVEWQTYKREVARLLAEGCEGKFALMKGDVVVGVWGNLRDALHEGQKRFDQGDFLVQEIQPFLPPSRNGYRRLCQD